MSQLYFKVDVYSHNFTLTRISARGLELIGEFSAPYKQWGVVRENRRFVRKVLKVFGTKLDDKTQFRFHIEQYPAFIKFLNELQVHESCYEVQCHIPDPGLTVLMPVREGWILRDYQVPINAYLISDLPLKRKLLEIQTGKGKAQPLDACIKVPGGWKFMGDMKVGDEVIAKDGSITKVNGVFPQGEKDIYRITFQDGRETECCLEHLWKIHKTNCIHQSKIVNTAELIRLKSLANNRVYVDLIDPEITPDVDLPIDPYVLGVLLGDGHLGKYRISLSSADQFIADEISQKLPESLHLRKIEGTYDWNIVRKEDHRSTGNWLKENLEKLDLIEKQSHDKFIPESYLMASSAQRLALLQGLMDTDGTISWCNTPSFSSVSFDLASAVQYLVRSLGGLAYITVKTPSFTYKGVKKLGKLAYQVNIRFKKPSDLFRLPRKKELTNDNHQYSNSLRLGVENIEFVGRKQAQCISIEHPEHLYVTDCFIPTHNTFSAMNAIGTISKRLVIFIKPMYIEKWVSDVSKICEIAEEDVIQVSGSAQLMKLIDLAITDQLDCKVIIVSNKTMQNWISLYERVGDDGIEMLGYGCKPQDFLSVVKAGMRLIDEVHQDFHLNFKLDLYSHVERSISLSATLVADDPFLTKMYLLAYPKAMRYAGLEYHKYIKSFSWIYRFNRPEVIRTTEYGSTTYSHIAFEKSVLKRPKEVVNYVEMIDACLRDTFLRHQKPGDKLLIYCSSINMCTYVAKHLKMMYPDRDIRRYVEDDPYDNLMSAEICVSTLLSAGTGHDIPGLTTVILTSAVSSTQSNIQGFGRLREIPGRDVRFIYFVCSDVPKHIDYHEKKKNILKETALSYDSISYSLLI